MEPKTVGAINYRSYKLENARETGYFLIYNIFVTFNYDTVTVTEEYNKTVIK